jgi:gp16 family phage-associated protein
MAMTYAQAVRRLFNESGVTQADFTRRTGFSTAYVSMLLSGKVKEPKFGKACVIADALGVTLEDFRRLMYD